MEFNNMVDSHRSQIKFYQLSILALIGVLGILAVIVPTSLKTGPYVIQDSGSGSTLMNSQPWKITITRVEGFLKLFLGARFEWTKETFDQKQAVLKAITADQVVAKLKDSIVGYHALATAQDAHGHYILEGFRFSNEQHVIEAQISRVLRLGNTGVVTPLVIRIGYEDVAVTDANPYGLRVKFVEESEATRGMEVQK